MRDSRSPALRGAGHGLRLVAAGLLSGVVGGAVAGLGARLAMYVIRLMNPSHNGAVTHAGSETGRFTAEGTLALVTEGAFYGLAGAVVYLAVRRWMPGRGLLKGLSFGCFLVVTTGPVIIDGNYEYFRYVSTWVSVGLFALLYPLFGTVVAPLTEWLGRGAPGRPANRAVAWTGYIALGALALWSSVRDLGVLRDRLRLFG